LSKELKKPKFLLTFCGVKLLEDNPYGMFVYDGQRLPMLKSLDCHGLVVYIGSFSKTMFPGLRLGYLVADQRVRGCGQTLAQELSEVKGLVTVNTSGLCQAVAATALRKHGNSLEPIVAPKRAQFRRNRDLMLESLGREFSEFGGNIQCS
jgi:(S)-3,5-dihydroxyphenylglycine transaminase